MKSTKPILIVLALTLLAIAFSLLLMPRTSEMALMQMKDKRFDEALAMYEQQKAQGVLTADVVSKLSELYLQQSDVEKAIAVMEEYVAAHPRDLKAREKLGTYYQYAQRTDDYLRNLEEINKLTPTAENLKTLADIYNFNSEYQSQAKTLKEIVATQPDEVKPQYFLDLANIQAANKEHDEAIATLQQFKKQMPDRFSFEGALLLVSLLLDKQQEQEALLVATEWQQINPAEYDSNAKLVNMLHYKGSPETARQLINKYSEDQIAASPTLLQEQILLQIAEGREEEVYDKLKTLHASGRMAPALKERLLYLALMHDDETTANAVLEDIDLKALNEAQLTVLAELSMVKNHPQVMQRLQRDFPASEVADTHPVLTAMLALDRGDKDVNSKLTKLENMEIGNSAALQMARACLLAGRKDCAARFLSKMPPAENTNNADIASAAEIYLQLKAWDDAQALLDKVKDRQSPAIEAARLKLAAATGNTAVVDPWLNEQSKQANPRLMADMFFLAFNNGHLDLATVIAERFHAQENSSLSRTALSQVYIKTGQYKEALNLLRTEATRSVDDEANYLFALAKLAAQDETYRKELSDYAAQRLRSDMPRKEKMALVYALITAKQVEPAMPYIRELALNEGGSWASLYAETLDKQGKHEEARKFWVSYAMQSSTPRKEKIAVAYTLLGNGYKADAENIFASMATSASANSQETKGLIYLWGPRPDKTNVEWVANRMRAAKGEDRQHWASLLSDITTDETIIALGDSNPDNLASPDLMRRYVEALARSGTLETHHAQMQELARTQGRTDLLQHYAQATSGAGFYRQSADAYATLFELGQSSPSMLRQAAIVSYNQSDYSKTREYLDRYLAVAPEERAKDRDAYEAYFVYAEMLRRDRKFEEMKPYYQASLDAMPPTKDPEILSRQAQALVWTDRLKDGLGNFQSAMKDYPKNDILRADYANTLVEIRNYQEARNILAQEPSLISDILDNPVNTSVSGQVVSHYQLVNGNSELLLFVPGGEKKVAALSNQFKTMPSIAYASEGYDTLLLSAKPGSKFDVSAQNGELAIRTVPGFNDLEVKSTAQTMLRYELLKARVELETGQVHAAADRLNTLVPDYQDDAQLLGFAANAENYGGNWPRAQALLSRARVLSPENEDIAQLDDNIRRQYAPGAKLDFEWIKRGNDDEYITSIDGYGYANQNALVGIIVQNNRVIAKNERLADGRVGNFDGNRQRGEVYGYYSWEENYVRGALFANNDTLGGGLIWHFLNPLGESAITGEYHRPYWDYTASVLDDTTRDFIGFDHTIKPLPEFSITAGPGFARYNTDPTDNVFSAVTFNLAAVYRLMEAQPFLALTYGIDAEYENSHKKGFDSQGNYTPLAPMRSRELHFLALATSYDFSERTYGDLIVGYGYDRLGGHGPSIEGSLTHELTESVDAQIRASYGLDTRSDDNLTRMGAYVRWKY